MANEVPQDGTVESERLHRTPGSRSYDSAPLSEQRQLTGELSGTVQRDRVLGIAPNRDDLDRPGQYHVETLDWPGS
jgi:hypothetical protein